VKSDSGNKSLHEAGHKSGWAVHEERSAPHGPRRTFNEAAHKLSYWQVSPAAVPVEPGVELEVADDERDVVAHASKVVLALGALGVVYGDLGTSPLYTMQVIFTQHSDAAHPTRAGVYGVVSLVFWAMTLIVSIKYAGLLMRVHNRGDGGGMALAALIQRRGIGRTALLVTLGIFGAGLFFGDGLITPAISVTSAVEGLKVVTPGL
jgi:KUP system potassium uptake protein